MNIFVDSNFFKYKNMICCHLFPGIDCTIDNFLNFTVNKLGMKQEWLQFSNKGLPHFDISKSKRKIALEKGVKEIENKNMKNVIDYWYNRRK